MPTTTTQPTGRLTVLQALADGPLTDGKLAVACWRLNPGLFSLRGEPDYPSDARLRNVLHGPSGVLARREVVRMPDGTLQLTGQGRERLGQNV